MHETNEGVQRADDLMDRERQQQRFERDAKAAESTNHKLDRITDLLERILERLGSGGTSKGQQP